MAKYFVTWAMSIFYIDGKGRKLVMISNRDYLTNHTRSKSRFAYGVDPQTHIHTNIPMPTRSDFRRPSVRRPASGLKSLPGMLLSW